MQGFKKKRKILWYFARLFVTFSFGENRRHLGNKRKKMDFFFVFRSICTIFARWIAKNPQRENGKERISI